MRSGSRPTPWALGLWLVVLAALAPRAGVAQAAPGAPPAPKSPTVAVLPFSDLAGGSRVLGEAIRETVSTDLKQIGALRVVERGSLDKLLAEQRLRAPRQDLDVSAVVKLGKVVGASLIVLGAYQRLAQQVRLTARFVKVETSEVIGVAKVDGTTREFLRLQDRVTAALLRSAGFPIHAKQVLDDSERRPELQRWETLELYGQAVSAATDDERRQYLRAAVSQDKDFRYAWKDLEELEQRMQRYQAAAQPIQERELAELRAQIRRTPERAQAEMLTIQLLGKLAGERRWHALVAAARSFLEELPAGAPISQSVDGIALMLLQYHSSLKDYDAVLRDAEWYLKRAPASSALPSIQILVQQTIETKRRMEEGRRQVETELADGQKDGSWDLCAVGDLCRNQEQYAAALRFYEACSQVGTRPRSQVLPLLMLTAHNGGLWRALRTLLPEWERVDARAAQKWRADYAGWVPEDE